MTCIHPWNHSTEVVNEAETVTSDKHFGKIAGIFSGPASPSGPDNRYRRVTNGTKSIASTTRISEYFLVIVCVL